MSPNDLPMNRSSGSVTCLASRATTPNAERVSYHGIRWLVGIRRRAHRAAGVLVSRIRSSASCTSCFGSMRRAFRAWRFRHDPMARKLPPPVRIASPEKSTPVTSAPRCASARLSAPKWHCRCKTRLLSSGPTSSGNSRSSSASRRPLPARSPQPGQVHAARRKMDRHAFIPIGTVETEDRIEVHSILASLFKSPDAAVDALIAPNFLEKKSTCGTVAKAKMDTTTIGRQFQTPKEDGARCRRHRTLRRSC